MKRTVYVVKYGKIQSRITIASQFLAWQYKTVYACALIHNIDLSKNTGSDILKFGSDWLAWPIVCCNVSWQNYMPRSKFNFKVTLNLGEAVLGRKGADRVEGG